MIIMSIIIIDHIIKPPSPQDGKDDVDSDKEEE